MEGQGNRQGWRGDSVRDSGGCTKEKVRLNFESTLILIEILHNQCGVFLESAIKLELYRTCRCRGPNRCNRYKRYKWHLSLNSTFPPPHYCALQQQLSLAVSLSSAYKAHRNIKWQHARRCARLAS